MSKKAVKKAVAKKATVKKVASPVGKVSVDAAVGGYRFKVAVLRMPVQSGRLYKTETSALKAGETYKENILAAMK